MKDSTRLKKELTELEGLLIEIEDGKITFGDNHDKDVQDLKDLRVKFVEWIEIALTKETKTK